MKTYLDRNGHCSIQGCTGTIKARRLCSKHYDRSWRLGDAGAIPKFIPASAGEPRAFLESISLEGSGCLRWPFATNGMGYAQISVGNGKRELVSRIMCEWKHGPPPSPTHHAAHSCGKGHESCIAPWHLSWKSAAENAADKERHGTALRGDQSPRAKLSSTDVKQILSLRGTIPQHEIASRFSVTQSMISRIYHGKAWKHPQAEIIAEMIGTTPDELDKAVAA